MSSLLYCATKLTFVRKDALHGNVEGGVATGFFWLRENILYLLTNWHSVTGIDPITQNSIAKSGLRPTHVNVPILLPADAIDGKQMAQRKRYEVALYRDNESPTWFEHPSLGNKVDVVAIELGQMDVNPVSKPINTIDEFVDFEPDLGDDVFVLGFPHGIDGGKELAIWKRGSIASSPSMDLDNLPKLLIDTATRKGMSGAPVIVRRRGLIVPRGAEAKPGQLSGNEVIGQADAFLGVYSGRLGDDELGVQVGIVWKARIIDEIVLSKKLGQLPV